MKTQLMTTKEVCEFFSYKDLKSVTNMVKAGYLLPRYIPNTKRPRFLRDEVEALVSKKPY